MNRKITLIIIMCFLSVLIITFFLRALLVKADELTEKAYDLIEDQEDLYNFYDDLEDKVSDTFENRKLTDTIYTISGVRGLPTNSYDSSKGWLFDESYFLNNDYTLHFRIRGSQYTDIYSYWFPDNIFDEDTEQNINYFANREGYKVYQINRGYCVVPYTGTDVDTGTAITNYNLITMNNFISDYGFISQNNNVGWWDPQDDPTPTPDPDPTPTPDPDPTPTPDPSGDVIVKTNEEYELMMIFVGGLVAGLIIGRVMLGFIK